jgi:hypothetical protein
VKKVSGKLSMNSFHKPSLDAARFLICNGVCLLLVHDHIDLCGSEL